MRLNRTPSLHDRDWRNAENENWENIESTYSAFTALEDFLAGFDGTQLIQKSYNLFNKDNVVRGRLNANTGEVIVESDTSWHTTGFIEVEPGRRLQIKPTQGTTVIYDSNYEYIQQITPGQHPMILPSNARYVRNTMGQSSIDGKYIYLGDEDLPYMEYGYSYMPEFHDLIRRIASEVVPGTDSDIKEYVNLFNKATVQNRLLNANTGEAEATDGSWRVSDYIPVLPGKLLQIHPNQGITVMYDENYNYIDDIGVNSHPFRLPSNARYIRNNMGLSSVEGKYIYLGENFMPYYPYMQGPGSIDSDDSRPRKVLIIGNSYSVDTFTYLHDICVSAGVNVVVGVAHDSGGSLSDAMSKINNSQTIHSYYKWTNQNGYTRTASPLYSVAITDEDWDIVIFQQMSFESRDYSTFQPHLTNLKEYVEGIATNPNVRFGINAIWERSTTAPSVGDKETQLNFFYDIVANYRQAMIDSNIEILIPTGTAIQNARENEYLSEVGYELTRDGAHLDEPVGRYIAAMTVFETLFDKSLFGDVSFSTEADKYHIYLAKMMARKAVDNPYKISEL